MQELRTTIANIFANYTNKEAYKFQVDALENIINKLNEGSQRLMVMAPTGTGKSTMTFVLAEYLLRSDIKGVLILTYNKSLEIFYNQMLAKRNENSINEINLWCDNPNKIIQISTTHKILKGFSNDKEPYINNLKSKFDFIIADEFQDYDVKEYRDFFSELGAKIITFSSLGSKTFNYEGMIPVIKLNEILSFSKIEFQLSTSDELLSVHKQVEHYRTELEKERKEKQDWQLKTQETIALSEKLKSDLINKHLREKAKLENEINQKDKIIESLLNSIGQLSSIMSNVDGSIKKLGDEVAGVKNDMNEGIERLSGEIQNVFEKIRNVIELLDDLQKDAQYKISKYAQSEDEKEKIYHEFSNTLMNKILEAIQAKEDARYNIERDNLISVFGLNNWNKLSPKSTEYLITSRIIFNNMLSYENQIDFSPACIPLTKALERELFINLFDEFKNFCKSQNIPIKNWPHGLTQYNRNNGTYHELYNDKFTLGSVPFIIGGKNDNSRPRNSISSRDMFIKYCREYLFRSDLGLDDNSLNSYLDCFEADIDLVTKRYRNQAAHKDEIKLRDAQECYNYLVAVTKVLVNFIDKLESRR